jgi:hypothetical protein
MAGHHIQWIGSLWKASSTRRRRQRRRMQREQRPALDQQRAQEAGHRAGDRHRRQAARTQFEQQQFHRQQQRGDRRAEHRRHAGHGAGHQQRLAFACAEVKVLRDQRADRAAGHDDRPLGAERAAAADGDARGQWLEQRHLGRHGALLEQDRLDGFRDAVAADRLGAVAGDQADDQAADHRHHDHPGDERVRGGRAERGGKFLEEEQIGEKADRVQQQVGGHGAQGADDGGDAGDQDQPGVAVEVAAGVIFSHGSVWVW